MGDDNVLDQNEIERLLGGGAPPPAPEAAPESPPAEETSGVLNQSELDALFGGGGDAAAASAPSSTGPLDQSDLDALFSGASAPAAPAPPSAAVPPPHPAPQPHQAASPQGFGTPLPLGGLGGRGGFGSGFGAGGMEGEEDEEGVPRGDIDYLLQRADESLRSVASEKMDLPAEVIEFQFPEFGGTVPSTEHATLDQISEVELDVKIELGRTNMYLEDVLKLRKGSVVPLDKMAGDAVDIFVNGRLLAKGEVLVMNENFCVRVAELLAGAIPME